MASSTRNGPMPLSQGPTSRQPQDLSGRKFHLEEERCNLKNAQFPLWLGDFQDRLYSGFRTPRYVEASRVARPKPMRQPVAGSGVDSMSKAVAGPNPKIQLAPPFVES